MTKPIDTARVRERATAIDPRMADPDMLAMADEIDRLRADVAEARALAERYQGERGTALADVAAMLPIVEAVGEWNPEDCPGHEAFAPCPIIAARRFLDARKVGP